MEHLLFLSKCSIFHDISKVLLWSIGLNSSRHDWKIVDWDIYYQHKQTLCLGLIGMDSVISESSYKGTVLQKNYRKMTRAFSYNSFVKFHGKNKFRSHNMAMFYPYIIVL